MILVTGASGFLGRHLVQRLSAKGLVVRALYHSHLPEEDLKALPGVTWMCCDLLDIFDIEEAMQGITEIYHCAAIVSFEPGQHEQMLHFNVESTANIVNQALEQGIRKMVHVSSVAALGRTGEQNKEITEEAEWGESKYNSAYGLSKYLAEMEVWRGIGEGLNAVIVNPGVILGPCKLWALPARLMKIVNKEFPFYTNGITSWVGVDDVVTAMVMLIESDVAAERFIISNGNFSFREIFTLMATALQKKPPRFHANSFLTGIGWRVAAVIPAFRSVISKETAITSNSNSFYNNKKLREAFPQFSYEPVQQTIEQMARSFIAEIRNGHSVKAVK